MTSLPKTLWITGASGFSARHLAAHLRRTQPSSRLIGLIRRAAGYIPDFDAWHAVDVTLNSPEEREEWQAARGIESVPWWPGDGLTDFSTGAGDFAESFAAWQVGTGSFRSRVGDAPNGDQLALMARLSGG